ARFRRTRVGRRKNNRSKNYSDSRFACLRALPFSDPIQSRREKMGAVWRVGFGRERRLHAARTPTKIKPQRPQAHLKPLFDIGSSRIRCPVAAKMALQTAGMTGGSAGSPNPVGSWLVFRKCTS